MEEKTKKRSGTYFLSSNLWTGHECPMIKDCFRELSYDEVLNLTAGSEVYVDQDPIHPNGHVYGYHCVAVTEVTLQREMYYLFFGEKGYSGSRLILKDRTRIYGVKNLELLETLEKIYPLLHIIDKNFRLNTDMQ